jgi:Mg-chelatase subunit ChlD
MTFAAVHLLHPSVLWLLPLALLPFLLHRRSEDASRRLVSALHLWPASPPPVQRAPRTNPFVLDRRSLLLAALIALILVALAAPVWRGRPAAVVLIVDTSASMGARLGPGTRLDRGREDALRALGDMAGGPVRLVAAGQPTVDHGRFAAGSDSLRTALAAIAPGVTASSLGQALALSTALEPGSPVWVLSDHAVTGVARSIVATSPADNVALTALVADAAANSPGTVTVTAHIEHTASAPGRATLTILAAGQTVATDDLALGVREAVTWTRLLDIGAGAIEARLTPAASDALATDNIRTAVVTPTVRVRIRLEEGAGAAIAQAIAANPAFAVTAGPDADVFVCRRCATGSTAPGMLRLAEIGAGESARAAVSIDGPAHPVTAGLAGLEATAAVASRSVAPTGTPSGIPSGAVLVRSGRTPAVSIDEDSRGRTVTLHADDTDAAFTRSAFFAVLIANAVDWLGGRDNPTTLDAGEPLRWRVGNAAGEAATATLTGPDGRARAVRLEHGWLTSTDTSSPGLYTVGTPRGRASLAVTTPAAESALDEPTETLAASTSGSPASPPVRPLAPFLLGAALALALVEWRAWPRIAGATPARAVCAVALAAATAGLAVPAGRQAVSVVIAIDRSDSIAPRDQLAAMAAAIRASRQAPDGDASGLVTFGGRPVVQRALAAMPLDTESGVETESDDTAIADAIVAALQLLPRSDAGSDGTGRIVLASDGWETSGRAVDAATAAATAGVAIDVLPLTARSSLPFVRSVQAPEDVRAGEPFAVDVALGGPAGRTATIALDGGDDTVTAEVRLGPDGLGTARLTARRTAPGLAVLRARTGDDPDPGAPGAAITVLGPPRLLHITPAEHPGGRVALSLPGYRVDRVPPGLAPASDAALAPYQLVVLDGIPGDALSGAAATALAEWTAGGGGLVMLGSQASLPPGGYAQPAVDALLPADLRVAPSSRTPATATIVAIDTSGSMADTVGGLQKLEAARDAVRRVSRALARDETFGVIAFDVRARAVAEPGPSARSGAGEAALEAALAALTPGGATRMAPAVELAATWFGAAGATRRHLLVVSDGRTTAEDLVLAGTRAARAGFTLSVIAIGADADRAGLTALAARTGGRVHFPTALAELPRLAAADVVASRGGATVTTPVALRAAGAHPALAGLPLNRLPEVGGYVVAAPRAGAEPMLDSTLSDPVFVAGRAGLGRVVLVTTDLGGTWTDGLRRWSGYPALLAQTLRWASRRDTGTGIDVAIEDAPTGATLRAWFEHGAAAGAASQAPIARLRTPDHRIVDLPLRPVSPQIFTAAVPTGSPGLYRVDVSAGETLRLTRGLVRRADRERTAAGTDDVLLRELARITGGRVLTAAADPFDVPRPLGFVPARPIPEALALLAIGVLAAGGRITWRGRHTGQTHGAAA